MENNKPQLDTQAVADWLQDHLGSSVHDLTPLAGGFWSTAFAYTLADDLNNDGYVLRFNANAEGFEIDRAAHAFAAAGLPVPEVLEIGQAMGCCYAISRRHPGRFMELVEPDAAPALSGAIGDLLQKMRRVPERSLVQWYAPVSGAPVSGAPATDLSWHQYLLRAIKPSQERPQNDFDSALRARPALHQLHETACQRIQELLPCCPERRDLVHGDLLHQNVLVSADADRVTAVFSWKCSAFGDFLYDVAWCTHWAPWHPGIAAVDVYQLTLAADDLSATDRLHMAERHHCYELQIAASHIGWYLWTEDEENLALLADGLSERLSRGPLTNH